MSVLYILAFIWLFLSFIWFMACCSEYSDFSLAVAGFTLPFALIIVPTKLVVNVIFRKFTKSRHWPSRTTIDKPEQIHYIGCTSDRVTASVQINKPNMVRTIRYWA